MPKIISFGLMTSKANFKNNMHTSGHIIRTCRAQTIGMNKINQQMQNDVKKTSNKPFRCWKSTAQNGWLFPAAIKENRAWKSTYSKTERSHKYTNNSNSYHPKNNAQKSEMKAHSQSGHKKLNNKNIKTRSNRSHWKNSVTSNHQTTHSLTNSIKLTPETTNVRNSHVENSLVETSNAKNYPIKCYHINFATKAETYRAKLQIVQTAIHKN